MTGHNDDAGRIAEQIRDAIGADPGDEIAITGSQHERRDGVEPSSPPLTKEAFEALAGLPTDDLADLGMRRWSGDIWLFPGEWYPHIPPGLEVVDIDGESLEWNFEETDDGIRFGVLAYGLRVSQDPPSGAKHDQTDS
jgi:hypothetical protein